MEKAIEIALRTWYPKDHPLHFKAHHPLGKLLGEWGELLDDYMKLLYKPNYRPDFSSELGDIWYYIRILCYQRNHIPYVMSLRTLQADKIIASAIGKISGAFIGLIEYNEWSTVCLDISYSVLLELLDRQDMTLDELTESNWQKLKPGSVRGEEWVRAWNGT